MRCGVIDLLLLLRVGGKSSLEDTYLLILRSLTGPLSATLVYPDLMQCLFIKQDIKKYPSLSPSGCEFVTSRSGSDMMDGVGSVPCGSSSLFHFEEPWPLSSLEGNVGLRGLCRVGGWRHGSQSQV